MKIDLKHAVIEMIDGSVTPKTLAINIGEGTFTWTEKRNIEYVKNRGNLDSTREGDEEPVDIRTDFVWEELASETGDTTPTPYEALKKEGPASSWVSSATDPCEPYAIDLRITYTPVCGGTDPEVLLFHDFRWESLDGDLRAGTVSLSGKANIVAPTITRG